MSNGREPVSWNETAVREAVRAIAANEGSFQVLHQKGTHQVVRYTCADGGTVVIKLWAQPGLKQWVRSLFGIRSVDYEWKALCRAQALRVPSPRPLGRCSGGLGPSSFTDAIVLEDLGACIPAMDHIKASIAAGEEEHLRAFEDEIISMTFEMASNGLYDTDHGVLNISVAEGSKPVSLDLEMARTSRLAARRRRLYGRMLGRLLLTYTFSVQPDIDRTLRFAERLRQKLDPPASVLRWANAYLQENMARQATQDPQLNFEVPPPVVSDPMQEPTAARKPATARKKLFVMCLTLVMTFLLLELAVRIHRGGAFSFENARKENFEVLKRQPAMYDATLGYVPEPGRHEEGLDFVANIDEATIRLNGEGPRLSGRPLLTTGDSFTFGDQVDDEDTWPARLEVELERPVLNGGVFGYGVDQIVLRAEQLLARYEPSVLIVSMIADDVRRAEMSYRYAWKPYFQIVDGELELRGVPVPEDRPPVELLWLRDALSYSYLADALLRRGARQWWLTTGSTQRVHDDGLEVAELLMKRLAAKAGQTGTHVLVVSQCDRGFDHEGLAPVLESARQAGMGTLDLSFELAQLAAEDPSLEERFYLGTFGGHMSPAGNAWVASRVAEELRVAGDTIDW